MRTIPKHLKFVDLEFVLDYLKFFECRDKVTSILTFSRHKIKTAMVD